MYAFLSVNPLLIPKNPRNNYTHAADNEREVVLKLFGIIQMDKNRTGDVRQLQDDSL
jgi:hypothetical protein